MFRGYISGGGGGSQVTEVTQAVSENARGTRFPRLQICKSLPSVGGHSYGKRTEKPGVASKSRSNLGKSRS